MNEKRAHGWRRFQKYYREFPEIGLAIDLSKMNVDEAFFTKMSPRVRKAFADMDALECGAIANPDEHRMAGHYWLRNPDSAPTAEIRREIKENILRIKRFSEKIHRGEIRAKGGKFKNYLLIGIGGSALGPQFVAHALSDPRTDKLRPFFFDNTDPDGMARVLATIGDELSQTLCLVISKSGGTKETRNGMLVAKAAYKKARLDFHEHAIAVTMQGSELDKVAQGWLMRFPMWDWVGGRTSELSAVGLLPAALQGFDIDDLLCGARICDKLTRTKNVKANPSMQLSLAFYRSGNGKGLKNMVVLPYKDSLELFSRYLQQLVMESLGKKFNLAKKIVNQGITVFGNKGSTDQHSYIQQLRDGLNDYFVVFIEVLKSRSRLGFVEPGVANEDFLDGFYLGTRQALAESGRESISVTVNEVSPFTIGALIAIFERAVGFYASIVNINAYNQPGVESGKIAASNVITAKKEIIKFLKNNTGKFGVKQIARAVKSDEELVFKICEYLAANLQIKKSVSNSPFKAKYSSI